MARGREPIGVVLAGGEGRRIGGSKAIVQLHGRPLISYPLEALRLALREVAVIAKPETELPSVRGVTVWVEPDRRQHPLVGILQALGLAGGRPVLVCALDLPFVTPALVRRIADADPGNGAAAIASSRSEVQPLLGCYQPRALELLAEPALDPEISLRDAVAALRPLLVEVEDPEALFNVNAPDDLLQAAAMLDRREAG